MSVDTTLTHIYTGEDDEEEIDEEERQLYEAIKTKQIIGTCMVVY